MTITINQEVKTSVEKQIPVPSFWKDVLGFTGVLDKNTVARVFLSDNYASITNGTPDQMKAFTKDLHKMEPTTEADFMNAYSEAYEAMRLEPRETGVYTSQILNNGHED